MPPSPKRPRTDKTDSVNLSGRRLRAALDVFTSDQVELHWHGQTSPLLITSPTDDHVRHVLSPMRMEYAGSEED